MCNQTVCLVAAELERHGIATVCLQLLRFIAEKVRPPRALWLPYRHGYPLAAPNQPAQQRAIIERALQTLEGPETSPGMIVDATE